MVVILIYTFFTFWGLLQQLCFDVHIIFQIRIIKFYKQIGGSLFVMFTYMYYESLRHHPSSLIFSRSIFDFGFGVIFFSLYFFDHSYLPCNLTNCGVMGSFILFTFLCSQGYFISSTIDLYLSISNPFGKSDQHVKKIHYSVILISFIIAFLLFITDSISWRNDLQFCFIEAIDEEGAWSINFLTAFLVYIPIGCFICVAIIVIITASKRLKNGLPDTFTIRQKSLTDGLFYTIGFTIYWAICGLSYVISWNAGLQSGSNRGWQVLFALVFGSLGNIFLILIFAS